MVPQVCAIAGRRSPLRLFIQQGNGMRALCKAAARMLPGTTIVMSPRHFKDEESLITYSKEVAEFGVNSCVDPQLYMSFLSRKTARMPEFCYWEKLATGSLVAGMDGLFDLNRQLGVENVVLPGHYLQKIETAELAKMKDFAEAAKGVKKAVYLTLCLAHGVFRAERQFNRLLKFLEGTDVSGVYIIPEHVDDDYLTDDPVWLQRVMELCADIRSIGKRVIIGYSGHQMLPLSCAAADALVVGKGRTTRTFRIDAFRKREEGDVGYAHPKPSYYCAQALSEYSLKYLDLARNKSVLELMSPTGFKPTREVGSLFSSKSPLSSGFGLQDGYLHYFLALDWQCRESSRGRTLEERKAWHAHVFAEAQDLLMLLHKHGVKGLLKDFLRYVDVSRSAIQAFGESRGTKLAMMDELYCKG